MLANRSSGSLTFADGLGVGRALPTDAASAFMVIFPSTDGRFAGNSVAVACGLLLSICLLLGASRASGMTDEKQSDSLELTEPGPSHDKAAGKGSPRWNFCS